MAFVQISPLDIRENVFQAVEKQWMLITAGTPERYNTMTASWGGMGVLWNRPVSFMFVRHSRYTFQFTEREDAYSLSFFDESHRSALTKLGTLSGRDTDKLAGTGLHTVFEEGVPYFEEAQLVLICKKLYASDISPYQFTDPALNDLYTDHDYHRMYVGEVVKVLERQA